MSWSFIPGLDSLNVSVYRYSLDFLEWLAMDSSQFVAIPKLSILIVSIWILLFLTWLIKHALQPEEDRSMERVFRYIQIFLANFTFLIFGATSVAVWIIYTHHHGSQKVLNWTLQVLVTPFLSTTLILAIINVIIGWIAVRHWLPGLNQWINKTITKKGYQTSSISDIREVSKLAPNSVNYDPQIYWDLQNAKMFIGLDMNDRPIHISMSEWVAQHQQVLGTTGFGKGVAITNQLSQCLTMGQTVVVFDPKNDEWAPSALMNIADHYNRPCCIIDLNADEPQFNPLYGADKSRIFDLFVGSFGLAEGRGDSDYYRSLERRTVRQWMEGLEKGQSLTQLADALTEADFKNASKLCNDLTELAMLGCINTRQKGAWFDVIDQGGLVYVIGSVRNEPVLRLQKMFLLRLMQRLEQRDRNKPHTHVTIFLDELKYLLCKPSLQALGTIRDKFANVILAHQSIDDLRDVPDDLDPQAVKSAVLENTALKLIYRSQDPDTVEWIAKRSGTIPAHREMLEQSRNEGFSEMTKGERRLIETEKYLIDQNMILSLQKRCGIWFSDGPAKIVLTSPVKTEKRAISPTSVDKIHEPVANMEAHSSYGNGLEDFS